MEVKSLNSVSNLYSQQSINSVQPTSDTQGSLQTSQIEKSTGLEKSQIIEGMDPEAELERTREDINEAVEKLNKTAGAFGRSLQFQVHDETKRTMVSVVDTENDKVIRQYPSEEVLDMVAKVDDYLGLIFDKKA